MKTLSCNDVSGKECSFVAKGETDEEVIDVLSAHGQEAHPEMVAEMKQQMSDKEMNQKMKENIKEE